MLEKPFSYYHWKLTEVLYHYIEDVGGLRSKKLEESPINSISSATLQELSLSIFPELLTALHTSYDSFEMTSFIVKGA